MNKENEDDLDNEVLLFNAMKKAKESFEKYFEDLGYDSAYFELRLEGWELDSNFKRWKKVTLEDDEKWKK